jgi:transposase
MSEPTPPPSSPSRDQASSGYAAFVAIDWADEKHTVCLQAADGSNVQRCSIEQKAQALADWLGGLRERFGGRPIAVIVESHRGALIAHMLQYEFLTLYLINPKSAAQYRQTFHPSGAKSDPIDADLLLDFLLHHRDRLRAWKPDTAQTRLLVQLSEDRRKLVDLRTAANNALEARLKQAYPVILELFEKTTQPIALAFLVKWPTLAELKKAKAPQIRKFLYAEHSRSEQLIQQRLALIEQAKAMTTDSAVLTAATMMIQALVAQMQGLNRSIEYYDQQLAQQTQAHPDQPIFGSFPGAGPVMTPRLIGALGDDRGRWTEANRLQTFSGVAPVEIGSGKSMVVRWRWACPKFVRQSFVEFARCSLATCQWAQAYYALLKARGKSHQMALRALAFKWMRILWRCWIDHATYDEPRYVASLRAKQSPIIAELEKITQAAAVKPKPVGE